MEDDEQLTLRDQTTQPRDLDVDLQRQRWWEPRGFGGEFDGYVVVKNTNRITCCGGQPPMIS